MGPRFEPLVAQRWPDISASRKIFENRLDASANLAIWSMHAKYQLIRAIHLARAMGVVRNSPPHLIIGGCLYTSSVTHLLKNIDFP